MRHYEIVFLVHPDQSEQVPAMVERYRGLIAADGGAVHRFEDWGRRQLAFPIAKMHKAHYVLMNIECSGKALEELTGSFRFSDAVLRHLVVEDGRRRHGALADGEGSPKSASAAIAAIASTAAIAAIAIRSATPWAWTDREATMSRFFRRKKFCKFTADGTDQIDYKDLATLKALHHGNRQDRAEPHHRHALVLPAPARGRDQAGALPRAPALHRPALRPAGASPLPAANRMTALLQSLTANPLRAFLAAGLAALLALFALPMAAWLPGALVVLGLLASGPGVAWAATAGAGFALVWAFSPLFGAAPALAAAVVMLLPALLAAFALEKSRSLSFAFQALTLASCLLVLAIHGLLGDPVRALAPVIAELEPMLRQTADMFSRMGIQSSPEQIGAATARMAWATLGWMVLLHAFVAQCAGLWCYSRLRQPGLFGHEFRSLRLGQFIAWTLVVNLRPEPRRASPCRPRLPGGGRRAVQCWRRHSWFRRSRS